MGDNTGEIQVYNPDKQISEQVTLKNILTHDAAMRLSRTGIPDLPSDKPLSFNQRMDNRLKGLNEIISAQQSLITNNKAIVRNNCEVQWGKKHKQDDEKKKSPFDKDANDYNELIAILDFLDACEQKIIKAKRTKMPDDDFIVKSEDHEGNMVLELTKNFFSMIKELEESYEEIYSALLKNKIVSSGFTVDEELGDKEKEEEAMRRIRES